jgi:hypothetical protein
LTSGCSPACRGGATAGRPEVRGRGSGTGPWRPVALGTGEAGNHLERELTALAVPQGLLGAPVLPMHLHNHTVWVTVSVDDPGSGMHVFGLAGLDGDGAWPASAASAR